MSGEAEEEERSVEELLAGLSSEELQQLQQEMEDMSPDQTRHTDRTRPGCEEEEDEEEEEEDEDALLAGLTPEELKLLQTEMEEIAPDHRVPVGMRQRDQTEKTPTGSFDRRSLVEYLYWEKESTRITEEERVPVTLLPSQMKTPEDAAIREEEEEEEKTEEDVMKPLDEGETGADEEEEEVMEVEDSEQSAVSSSSSSSLQPSDIPPGSGAQENQADPRTAVYENWVPEKEERIISKLKIPKLALGGTALAKKTARPSGNETNLETTLDKIGNNNPSVTDVNLNNIENIPKEMLLSYVGALKRNRHVKTFSIANTGADENVAFSLANMLRENKSITTLNIESNFISGKGIVAIIRCLQFNETLSELRFHNQRHMLGHHAEMEVSRLLKANHTLLKMGYHFELPGPRMVVTNLLTRNLDRQRQQRMEEQKLQQLKEQRSVLELLGDSDLLTVLQEDVPPGSPDPPSPPRLPNPLEEVQLRRTPKRRDPLLELNLGPERTEGPACLRSVPKQRSRSPAADDRPNLKDMIRTLKPVPRRREPPKVDLTPRDHLLKEIRQSSVAYLRAVPLPKILESQETSLF